MTSLFDISVSLFKNANTPKNPTQTRISTILERIQTGTYKTQINKLRKLKQAGKKSEYDALKKTLPAVTWQGEFVYRSTQGFKEPSGFLPFDIDHLPDVLTMKTHLSKDEHIAFLFLSPGADGLKGAVRVPVWKTEAEYKFLWENVRDHFQQYYALTLDRNRSDLAGLCFVSYDPELYRNEAAAEFPIDWTKFEQQQTAPRKVKASTPRTHTEPQRPDLPAGDTLQQAVIETLQEHGAKLFDEYPEFIRLAMGLKSEQLPFEVLDSIVCHSANYDQGENRRIYEKLNPEKITFGTVYDYAEKADAARLKELCRKYSDLPKEGGKGNRPPHPAESYEVIGVNESPTDEPPATDGNTPRPKEQKRTEKFYHLTDLGNAQRFVDGQGDNLRFCPEHDKWFTWNGNLWERDKGKNVAVFRHATNVIKSLYTAAGNAQDSEDRKTLSKWARESESRKRLSDMVFLAARDPRICLDQNCFDNHPMLLNCKNGMVDLATGKLTPSQRSHYATRMIPVNFNSSATCPEFLKFLNKIMGKKEELVGFLQRAMGYTLTGIISEECLFFLHGKGKNGKSTFINILSYMLGDYRQHLKIESLMLKNYDGIPNDIAQLPGARLLTASEVPEGRHLNESLVKDLTGGDTMTARFMRGEFFSFTPIFKLWMFGNHEPRITGTDDGIWRRIRKIPFTVQIPPEERIPRHKLEATLQAEAEGILKWMIDGCLEWQRDGLKEPPEVLEATEEYRKNMDELQDFIDEYCVIGSAYHITTKELYAAYIHWCGESANKPEGKLKFNQRIEEKFPTLQKERGSGNKPTWYGIGLMHDEEEAEEEVF